jgi:arabinolytic transcriptional activator AraR
MPSTAPCKICGRVFSRPDSLTRHLKVHGSHVERGPIHRIINEKFRACSNCRKAKVRCPGSLTGGVCARCSQNGVPCTYEKKKSVASTPEATSPTPTLITTPSTTVPTSIEEDVQRVSRMTIVSSRTPITEPDQSSPPTHAVGRTQRSLSLSESLHILSPPESSPRLVRENPRADHNTPSSLFELPKGFISSTAHSTYVSPTIRILDPYSYKLPSIPDSHESPSRNAFALANCRYPVLKYLVPFLEAEFSAILACDLLDTYFSSAFSSRMHPSCHHIHNFILRRCDVLDPLHPRRMHPALLASMLFVAALSDKALSLFSGPEEKDRICKYLSLLTYRLLNPSRHEPLLSHEDLGLPLHCDATPGWTNQELQHALHPHQQIESLPITWGTDYIITFIHVSSVISGSEKKAASIRWQVLSHPLLTLLDADNEQVECRI